MSTSWNSRTSPTTTWTGRIKPGDFTYYTWDSCPDIWDLAIYTWDASGVGISTTTWTGRVTP